SEPRTRPCTRRCAPCVPKASSSGATAARRSGTCAPCASRRACLPDSLRRRAAAGAGRRPGGAARRARPARCHRGERFGWLTAPRRTVVQTSPVHTGVTVDPAGELDHLVEILVDRQG